MLEVRDLLKRFNRIPAVDGVSFAIRPGEILAYLGPNGAGKSTTVKVLTGLIDPTSGEILFHGRDVRAGWVGFQRRMGYVPEEAHLYPHLLFGILLGLWVKLRHARHGGLGARQAGVRGTARACGANPEHRKGVISDFFSRNFARELYPRDKQRHSSRTWDAELLNVIGFAVAN